MVQIASRTLLKYGTFRWSRQDGFVFDRHDTARLNAFFIQAVHDKRLVRGRWNRRVWIGFTTLSRMVRSFLQHNHEHGCANFDTVIAKCLSVVLIAALGCRAGDVGRS